MKVLLVEDNCLNLEMAQFILEEKGIMVVCAENGKQAIEIFQKSEFRSFDAILMDIMMPVMNGLEAAKAIRDLPREDAKFVPIFAMTANASDIDRQKSREAGINEHLTKPLNIEKLYHALKMAV